MSKFALAMAASATTANGAVSLTTPDISGEVDGRLSIFFKAVRGLEDTTLFEYLTKSVHESINDTFLMAFYIRDCRGGKGERDLGRKMFQWLFFNYPEEFSGVAHLIPDYGRWDDMIHLFPSIINFFIETHLHFHTLQVKEMIVSRAILFPQLMAKQLKTDLLSMNVGEPATLTAKWAPTENDKDDKKYGTYICLAHALGVNSRELRKTYITPLRAYTCVVEQLMCGKKWGEINFNKVPGCAMHRLKKAFEKNDPNRFIAWRAALKNGNLSVAKVCASTIDPYTLVREMRTKRTADAVLSAQWDVIEKNVMDMGMLDDSVVVVDTSASMHTPNYIPYDVAISMGMLISRCTKGEFKDHVMTFNTTPEMVVVKGDDLYSRYTQIASISWGGSTNIQAIFNLILKRGKEYGLTPQHMPKRLWIVSDMQFDEDSACIGRTNFEIIDAKYAESGYTRPQIVFWNVNGNSKDFPVSVNNEGVCIISGYSAATMKSVLFSNDFNPVGVMRAALDNERYDQVRVGLGVNIN
jgi:hypothetical protein